MHRAAREFRDGQATMTLKFVLRAEAIKAAMYFPKIRAICFSFNTAGWKSEKFFTAVIERRTLRFVAMASLRRHIGNSTSSFVFSYMIDSDANEFHDAVNGCYELNN